MFNFKFKGPIFWKVGFPVFFCESINAQSTEECTLYSRALVSLLAQLATASTGASNHWGKEVFMQVGQ